MDRISMQRFQQDVYKIVRSVPRGKVATYGQIASKINPPATVAADTYRAFAARWVGGALAACPPDVPWQRVVNSQGKISDRPGADKQRHMLELEGIEFDAKGRIDLKRFGWEGQLTSKAGSGNISAR